MRSGSSTREQANAVKHRGNYAFIAAKAWPSDNILVFGIHIPSDAELNRAADSQEEYLGRRPKELQQRGNDDVRVENNPDHAPGCGLASRLALRAAAISASMSSMES